MKLFRKQQKNLGVLGEDAASRFLKKKKYKILERNWYNKIGKRLGEIDLICEKNDVIVFVEVKTREVQNRENVIPEEQITSSKLQKLHRVGERYIVEHDLWNKNWRFDAIAVYMRNNKICDIKHIENIFF